MRRPKGDQLSRRIAVNTLLGRRTSSLVEIERECMVGKRVRADPASMYALCDREPIRQELGSAAR
jgi:hypothetical protein